MFVYFCNKNEINTKCIHWIGYWWTANDINKFLSFRYNSMETKHRSTSRTIIWWHIGLNGWNGFVLMNFITEYYEIPVLQTLWHNDLARYSQFRSMTTKWPNYRLSLCLWLTCLVVHIMAIQWYWLWIFFNF